MNDVINQASENASALEAFVRDHTIIAAIIVATVCSWALTAAIKGWISTGPRKALAVRTIDCAIAGVLAAIMLHDQFAWHILTGVCLLIGSGSPFAYWILSELVCWKWPGLRKYLALRELAPDPTPADETGDDTRIPKDPPT